MYACTLGVGEHHRGNGETTARREKKVDVPGEGPPAPHARGIIGRKNQKTLYQLLRRPGQRPGKLFIMYYLLSGSTAATSTGFSVVPSDAGAPMVVARATFVVHLHGDN